jgi:phosphoribosylglycinamide formyltransferase-1
MRVAVCASGKGSNLEALVEALPAGSPAEVALVISNRKECGAIGFAEKRRIPAATLANFSDPNEWLELLGKWSIDFVVLAGFLKKVPVEVVRAFQGRIINIHPALLPDHGGPGMYGLAVHRAVLARGDRESGATVHLVTARYDEGPILGRATVPVLADDTPERLAERVLAVEHRLLPAAVTAAAGLGKGRAVAFTLNH